MATVKFDSEKLAGLDELVASGKTVVIDFWAAWCGPCRAFGPIFEAVSNEHPEAVFAKVNVDEEQDFAMNNRISSIPMVWVFKNGEKVYAQPGVLKRDQLEALIG